MTSRTITTVTAAASSRMLTTRATVKSVLQISGGDDDAYIDLLIRQASAVAENYCNRVFAQQSLSDLIMPDRDSYPYQVPGNVMALQASSWPITAIASVTEDGTALVNGTDYQVDLDKGLFYRMAVGGTWPVPWPSLPVTIAYTAGYVLPGDSGSTLVADIEAGVIEIVKGLWMARTRDPAIRSESVPELLSTSYQIAMPNGSGLPPAAEAYLTNYRVPVTT